MAIFHLSVKVISRSSGRSAVAAAAYRGAERLHDERLDRDHDFTNQDGVVHSDVLLPEGAPEEFADREKLWNAVEAFVVQPLGPAIGRCRHGAAPARPADDFNGEVEDCHDGNPSTPSSARRHDV